MIELDDGLESRDLFGEFRSLFLKSLDLDLESIDIACLTRWQLIELFLDCCSLLLERFDALAFALDALSLSLETCSRLMYPLETALELGRFLRVTRDVAPGLFQD